MSKRMSRAGTSIAHLAQRLVYVYTELPVKDETSETIVQNVFIIIIIMPLLKIPVLYCKLFLTQIIIFLI